MLVSSQKSGNTQVTVLLSQLRHVQGVPFTFSHFTISVMQVFVARCNACVPRSQDTSMLAIYGPSRTRESEIWTLSSQSKKRHQSILTVRGCLSHEVMCSHVLLPSLPLASQRELRNTPGKGKMYHQHRNLRRHPTQPPRCLCCRSLVPDTQWSRKATWRKVDTPLQIVRAIQVKGSPLSTDFIEKLALRLSSSSFRQNLRKLDQPSLLF